LKTVCKNNNKKTRKSKYNFKNLGKRRLEGRFDGGEISSDGGGVFLREVEHNYKIVKQLSACFTDYRDDSYTEHSVYNMLCQRIFGIALGYEDLNDHDDLRRDPLFAAIVGKDEPDGSDRTHRSDAGCALASKSTLNRLELTPDDADSSNRYKKVVANFEQINRLFVKYYFQTNPTPPEEIVLDADPTDDPLHGNQEGRFFHGYYGCYCYLPLFIYSGDDILCAVLLKANASQPQELLKQLKWLIPMIRENWPDVKITVRGDCAFQSDDVMSWCEGNDVDYVLGLTRNQRLENKIKDLRIKAEKLFEEKEEPSRLYSDFMYRTQDSWSRSRRVVTKVEHNPKGRNSRFVVTSKSSDDYKPKDLYENGYCPRGDMENRIKEIQLYLFSDRTSTSLMHSNQLRLWFSTVAYVLVNTLRKFGLKSTKFARAQCHTIRTKLFKIGAAVTVSVRRVYFSWSSSYPYKNTFNKIYSNLRKLVPT